jgi:hypothetical protein
MAEFSTMTKYVQEFKTNLDAIVARMEREFGDRPDIDVSVEPFFKVKMSFNMKGFAHKGQSFSINPRTIKRISAARRAKDVEFELVTHRTGCVECGEGKPDLSSRVIILQRVVRYLKNDPAFNPNPSYGVRINNWPYLDRVPVGGGNYVDGVHISTIMEPLNQYEKEVWSSHAWGRKILATFEDIRQQVNVLMRNDFLLDGYAA